MVDGRGLGAPQASIHAALPAAGNVTADARVSRTGFLLTVPARDRYYAGMLKSLFHSMALAVPAAALLTVGVGCQTTHPEARISQATVNLDMQSAEADRFWQDMQDTLRGDRYRIDRTDRRGGVLTTKPETSEHWFELWRHDVATWRDWAEATINPLRRWVEVRLTPHGTQTGIEVFVHKQRQTSPDRQFNDSGAAYQFFGNSLPSTTGAPSVTAADERWIDVGRDPAMENYFLLRFLRLLKSEVAGESGNAAIQPA